LHAGTHEENLPGATGGDRRVAGEYELAVKSSLLLSFLESVPDVAAKLKAPVTADRKFEHVVKSA